MFEMVNETEAQQVGTRLRLAAERLVGGGEIVSLLALEREARGSFPKSDGATPLVALQRRSVGSACQYQCHGSKPIPWRLSRG